MSGNLYIVATPIGNLGDVSSRAIEILGSVDWVVAEDTRHSKQLFVKLGLQHVQKQMLTLHDHNEEWQTEKLCTLLKDGASIALISDAGTPLISDPGYQLVRQAQEAGIKVVPIPGPSALLAALSVSGLPTDQFIFLGFLPAKSNARRQRLEEVQMDTRSLIFYEAPHRLLDTLADMAAIFGGDREAVVARELTKTFETVRRAAFNTLLEWVRSDPNQSKGEIVLLVRGASKAREHECSEAAVKTLKILIEELPTKQAASLASKITGVSKHILYDLAVTLKN